MSFFADIPSKLLESIVKSRNTRFDEGKISIYKSTKPIISIGNLTFGGSGKTPFTIALAKELIELGLKPGIIGRGYKRISKNLNIIHDGEQTLSDWQNAGDEMFLIANKLQIPVVVHNEKFQAAKIIEQLDTDVTILDDGFQHRYLYRDLDLVIIDQNTIENPALPPRGNLREPIESLKRADLLLADENLSISNKFTKFNQYQPIRFKIKVSSAYDIFTKENYNIDGCKILAFCGIANPYRFNLTVIKAGAFPSKTITFKDHHKYSYHDIRKLIHHANKINVKKLITTEKDAVKLKQFASLIKKNNLIILAIPIEIEITNGKNILTDFIQNKIIKKLL